MCRGITAAVLQCNMKTSQSPSVFVTGQQGRQQSSAGASSIDAGGPRQCEGRHLMLQRGGTPEAALWRGQGGC
jgi:hypothetical protein